MSFSDFEYDYGFVDMPSTSSIRRLSDVGKLKDSVVPRTAPEGQPSSKSSSQVSDTRYMDLIMDWTAEFPRSHTDDGTTYYNMFDMPMGESLSLNRVPRRLSCRKPAARPEPSLDESFDSTPNFPNKAFAECYDATNIQTVFVQETPRDARQYAKIPLKNPTDTTTKFPLAPVAVTGDTLKGLPDPDILLSMEEVLKDTYSRNNIALDSIVVQVAKQHFLVGHNVLLVVGNTPDSAFVAQENLVSVIEKVLLDLFRICDLSEKAVLLTAHALHTNGMVTNLLRPKGTGAFAAEKALLGKNPVSGVSIVNSHLVRVGSAAEGRAVVETALYNSQCTSLNPCKHSKTITLFEILHRKCTKLSVGTNKHSNHVYMSSFKVLYIGDNTEQAESMLIRRSIGQLAPLFKESFGGSCRTSGLFFVNTEVKSLSTIAAFLRKTESINNQKPHTGSVKRYLRSASLSDFSNVADIRRDAERLLEKGDVASVSLFYPLKNGPHFPAVEYVRPSEIALYADHKSEGILTNSETAPVAPSPTQGAPRSNRPAKEVKTVMVAMPSYIQLKEKNASKSESMRRTLQENPRVAEQLPVMTLSSNRMIPPKSKQVFPLHRSGTSLSLTERPRSSTALKRKMSSSDTLSDHLEELREEMAKQKRMLNNHKSVMEFCAKILLMHNVDPPRSGREKQGKNPTCNIVNMDKDSFQIDFTPSEAERVGLNSVRVEVEETRRLTEGRASDTVNSFAETRKFLNCIRNYNCNTGIISCQMGRSTFTQDPAFITAFNALEALFEKKERYPDRKVSIMVGAALLCGKNVVADLSLDGRREPFPCRVSASPIFGNIVHDVCMTPLEDVPHAEEVLTDMLHRADRKVGKDKLHDPYVYFWCISTHRYPLLRSEQMTPEMIRRGYTQEAEVSCFSVLSLLGNTDIVSDALQLDFSRFPTPLIGNMIDGICYTIIMVTLDQYHCRNEALMKCFIDLNGVCSQLKDSPITEPVSVYASGWRQEADELRLKMMKDDTQSQEMRELGDEAAQLATYASQHEEVYLKSPTVQDDSPVMYFMSYEGDEKPAGDLAQSLSTTADHKSREVGSASMSSKTSTGGLDPSIQATTAVSPYVASVASLNRIRTLTFLIETKGLTDSMMSLNEMMIITRMKQDPNQLWVESRFACQQQIFTSDETICVTQERNEGYNAKEMVSSEYMKTALSQFASGINVGIILQESGVALRTKASDFLIRHTLHKAFSADGQYFVSLTILTDEGAIDLLGSTVSDASLRKDVSLVGNLLMGNYVSCAPIQPAASFHSADTMVSKGLRAVRSLRAFKQPHVIFLNLWQFIRLSGEDDVLGSSLQIFVSRGGAFAEVETEDAERGPGFLAMVRLLRHVLCGPFHTLLGAILSNTEPDDEKNADLIFQTLGSLAEYSRLEKDRVKEVNSFAVYTKRLRSAVEAQKKRCRQMEEEVLTSSNAKNAEELVQALKQKIILLEGILNDNEAFLKNKWTGRLPPAREL